MLTLSDASVLSQQQTSVLSQQQTSASAFIRWASSGMSIGIRNCSALSGGVRSYLATAHMMTLVCCSPTTAQFSRVYMRVCQRGWAGRPGPQPFTFIDWPWASPASPTPHFYRQGLSRPGPPEPFTFIDGACGPGRATPIHHFYRQCRVAQPFTSIGQTPRFYQLGQA